MCKRALLIAGTGTMGVHVTDLLIKEGFKCWVTSRSIRKDKEGVHYLQGDPHNSEFLINTLSMYHWSVIVDFTYYSVEELKNVYDLFLVNSDLYVFLSTARVYADYSGRIHEDCPRLLDVCQDRDYLASNEYAIAKAKEEDYFLKSNKKNWIIVRPYITYGENTFQLSSIRKEFWLLRALKGKAIYFAEELSNKLTTFTYGYDVAKGIVSLITNKNSWGDVYNVMTMESLKWSDILDIYLNVLEKYLGYRPKVYMVDKWTPLMTGTYDQIRYDRLYNREFDCSKLLKFVDVHSFVSPEKGIEKCLLSYLNNSHGDEKVYISHEAQVDKITGDWETLRMLFTHSFGDILRYLYYRLR